MKKGATTTLSAYMNSSAPPPRLNGHFRRRHHNLMQLLILAVLTLFGATHVALANNIQVANSKVVFDDAENTLIEFDLSWENSWRTNNLFPDDDHDVGNWDAAWVFVKYRESGGTNWQHVWLSTDDSAHSSGAGTPAIIDVGTTNIGGTDRGMGAFIYRAENGTGTFSIEKARLQWNFEDQGLDPKKSVEIQVFAIEMVYVPEGAFFVGDTSSTRRFRVGGTNDPFEITSEGAINFGTGAEQLDAPFESLSGELPASFPKGFSAFYMMKYSVAQQQYVDFLNTLTRTQQQRRFPSQQVGHFMSNQPTPAHRNGVRFMSQTTTSAPRVFGSDLNNNNSAGEADDGQWIAMNYISWADGAAYMDWAGLRPMTELEYEKAARGPASPVDREYAWGTPDLTAATEISNAGGIGEVASDAAANAVVANSTGGPLRVGAFAKADTTREQAGASYWGIMELSGNLRERVVAVNAAEGRQFTGQHGDGALSAQGEANVDAWPGPDARGAGFRGGDWESQTSDARVSDRNQARILNSQRDRRFGYRGVRSAPAGPE